MHLYIPFFQKKAEEAIKTAQNKPEPEKKEETPYTDYRGSFDGTTQNSGINMLSQYSDLNRHIQMVCCTFGCFKT